MELVVLFHDSLTSRFILFFYSPKLRGQLAKFFPGQALQLELSLNNLSKPCFLFPGSLAAYVYDLWINEFLIARDYFCGHFSRDGTDVVRNLCVLPVVLISNALNVVIEFAYEHATIVVFGNEIPWEPVYDFLQLLPRMF